MAKITHLTEREKNIFIHRYMDQNTNTEHMLTFNKKSTLNQKDYLKSYTVNKFTTVEGLSLAIVGTPKQVLKLL